MAKQQAQTKITEDWLASMEQEEVELKTKVKKLEVYLNNSVPTSIKELQVTESCLYRETYRKLTDRGKNPYFKVCHPQSLQPANVFPFD